MCASAATRPQTRRANALAAREVVIGPLGLAGTLHLPASASALVVFAHGSGSSRFSSRNIAVANALNAQGIATLLFDLLTPDEESRWPLCPAGRRKPRRALRSCGACAAVSSGPQRSRQGAPGRTSSGRRPSGGTPTARGVEEGAADLLPAGRPPRGAFSIRI